MNKNFADYTYNKVNDYLIKNNYDVMVVTSCENCYYLSGVSLYYNAVIIKKNEEPILLVKYIDRQLAQNESHIKNIRGYSPYPIDFGEDIIIGDYANSIATIITELGCENKKICISDFWAVLRPYLGLKMVLKDAEIVVSEPFLEKTRCVKHKTEVDRIQKSVDLLDKALYSSAPLFREGITEAEVVGEISRSIWSNAGELCHAIIASGANSLLPHSKISEKKFRDGENVVVDLVSNYEGYYAGLTRTFVIGTPNKQKKEVYDFILSVANEVYTTVRPGMEIGKIAQIATKLYKDNGYGNCIKHAFGHGIGVFQHEMPILNTSEKRPLEEGMIFCFEPGIYINDLGGFRLGDLVIMTANGFKRMNCNHLSLTPEVKNSINL